MKVFSKMEQGNKRTHTEYKILETKSYPTNGEINAHYGSKEKFGMPGWRRDLTFYRTKLPHTSDLKDRAKKQLEEEISLYLNQGWRLSGSLNTTFIKTHTYDGGTFDEISFTQPITREEDYDVYQERVRRELEWKRREEEEAPIRRKLEKEELEKRMLKEIQEIKEQKLRAQKAEVQQKEEEEKQRCIQEARQKIKEEEQRIINEAKEKQENKITITDCGDRCQIWKGGRQMNSNPWERGGEFEMPEEYEGNLKDLPFIYKCPQCQLRVKGKFMMMPAGERCGGSAWIRCANAPNEIDEIYCPQGHYRYSYLTKKHSLNGNEWDPEDPDGSIQRKSELTKKEKQLEQELYQITDELNRLRSR